MASGTRVYVGNLLAGVDKGELQKEFSRFGKLREVWVARNPPGFAFVEFFAYVDAERAVSSLDGRHLLGSKVTVQMSRKPLKRGRDGRMRQGAGPHRQGGRRPMPRPDMRYRGERNPPMSKPPPRAASPGYDPPPNRPRPVKPMNTKSYDLAKSRIAKKLTQRSRINVLRKRPAPAGKFTKTGRKLSQGGTLPVQKNVRSARTSSSDYEDDRPAKATAVHKKMNVSQKVAKIKKKKAVKKVGKHAQSRSMDRSSRSQSPYERPPPRHVGPSTPPRSPRSWSPRRWTPSPPRRNTSPRPMVNPPPMPLMRNRRSPPPPYADKRRRNQSPVPRWSPSAVPLRYPSPPPRDNYYNYSPASEYNMPWRDPVYPYDDRWQGDGMKHYPSQSRPRSRYCFIGG